MFFSYSMVSNASLLNNFYKGQGKSLEKKKNKNKKKEKKLCTKPCPETMSIQSLTAKSTLWLKGDKVCQDHPSF